MTARRQENKGHRLRIAALVTALPACLALWSVAGGEVRAATTERVVVDRHTGLAISGYDPVTYFTDAKPVFESPIGKS